MKQTINITDFHTAFEKAGRGETFSYEAREIIFQDLTDIEESSGNEFELDPIMFCCDYEEMAKDDFIADYGYLLKKEDITEEDIISFLTDEGVFLGKTENGTFVFRTM